ncbi:MAG: XRE family transcriptional regulator [Flavobacteriales bacterium CG_4_9_14_3_um_filter_32_8]|nr:MAG: XRE family transcriptional regulator [Flavobacteriales bacterium CG_4_9_14_3_um_filter_32_8]
MNIGKFAYNIFLNQYHLCFKVDTEKKHFIIKFGKNLQRIRIEKKLTQSQLAADSNVEISQISRIERGVLNTSIGNIYTISKALDITVDELFKI